MNAEESRAETLRIGATITALIQLMDTALPLIRP
jgi:hypothetical protein